MAHTLLQVYKLGRQAAVEIGGEIFLDGDVS